MPLDATVLANLIKTNVQAISNFPSPGVSPVFSDDRVLQAVAAAIVTHITTAAVVVVASVSGVQTGSGTSGPGTGTVT